MTDHREPERIAHDYGAWLADQHFDQCLFWVLLGIYGPIILLAVAIWWKP